MSTEIKAVLTIIVFGCWSLFMYHMGGLNCRLVDATAAAEQESANVAKITTENKTITEEAQTHAAALNTPTDPTPAVICVRKYATPAALSTTSPARPISHDPADLPTAANQPVQPITDIAKPAAEIGKACDAQLIEAQSYIRDVCQK